MRIIGALVAVILGLGIFLGLSVAGVFSGGGNSDAKTQSVIYVCSDGTKVSDLAKCPTGGQTQVPTQPNGGGGITSTSCGAITWGSAGPAPGTGSSDSAKQVTEAAQVMQVDLQSIQFLTVHKFCPGDDTPNGWILGSSQTEANGIRVSAGFLPAGVCVDYDPGVTKITGSIEHTQAFNPRWSRSLLASNGSASGLKFTVYWTPCQFTDQFVSSGIKASAPSQTSTTVAGCPQSDQEIKNLIKNNSGAWSKLNGEPCAWVYSGPAIGFQVPQGFEVDYDAGGKAGKLQAGATVPSGIVFTLRKL